MAPTKAILRHVDGLIQYYLDTRNETTITLTGESPMALMRDYIESLAERGRTAPAAGKQALSLSLFGKRPSASIGR